MKKSLRLELGNLVMDHEEGTEISWTPYGKVRSVHKSADNVTNRYRYYASGNRVEKRVEKDGETTLTRYVRDASGNVMAVYTGEAQAECHLYGSSRLGMGRGKAQSGQLKLGLRSYELSNHLGNVLAVITDNVNMTPDTEASQWHGSKTWATVLNTSDYYPFGLQMAGRTTTLDSEYRYGFNGKEKDTDFDNHYDYGFRIYNPRIAKFLSVDPLFQSYPWYTPYQFAGNKPVMASDLDGLEEKVEIYQYNEKKPQIFIVTDRKGRIAIDNFYEAFKNPADLNSDFGYFWEEGYYEYTKAGNQPFYKGTLKIQVGLNNVLHLSYDPTPIPKQQYEIIDGFVSLGHLWRDFFVSQDEGSRVARGVTGGIVGLALAIPTAGQSLTWFGGIELLFAANQLLSGVTDAADGVDKGRNLMREGADAVGGEKGEKTYDVTEFGVNASGFIKSIYNIRKELIRKNFDNASMEVPGAVKSLNDLISEE